MPVAAIPEYLGQNFDDASPGMRFGMYLPIWTHRADQESDVNQRASKKSREGHEVDSMLQQEGMNATITALQQRQINPVPHLWKKNDHAARDAWRRIAALSQRDLRLMAALVTRQAAAFQADSTLAGRLALHARATAPFTTGLGNEHPLENGFAFLNPYGLPYLPGTGVKGVLRQAARELASGDWGEAGGWSEELNFKIGSGEATISLSMIDALFGREVASGDGDHVRGALVFWDVIPRISGKGLDVEIMTPHQTHYYQNGESPHDSGKPTPISFLTVPPGSGFSFHVQCDLAHLANLAPELARDDRWADLLKAAFEHAFDWLGFGAKTAVGYGHMGIDTGEMQRQKEQEREAEKEKALAGLPEEERLMAEFAEQLRNDRANQGKGPTGDLWESLRALVEQAEDWSLDDRQQLKDLMKEAFAHMGVDRKKSNAGKKLWNRIRTE